MGIDARIQFDAPKLTTKEVMVDMAYDLACRIDGFDQHPCITWSEYDNRYEVEYWSRYWGIDYERGDWAKLRAILDILLSWKRQGKIKEVYYGGDHEDSIGRFTETLMGAYDIHFRSGTWKYRSNEWLAVPDTITRPTDVYGKPMRCSGGGQKARFFYSLATGEQVEVPLP